MCQMAQDKKENSEMTSHMDMVCSINQMVADTRESSEIMQCMDRAHYIK